MLHAIVAFLGAVFLINLLRGPAGRFGLVDKPSPRKMHLGEIPAIGGLAIGMAFLCTAFLQYPPDKEFLPFVTCCFVVLLTGLGDDLREFSARSKFVGQVIAAVLMTSWAGLFLTDLGDLWGGGNVLLKGWAIPFTLFCVVGLVNAVNMIDGMDGLAGGIAAIAAAWLCMAAVLGHPVHDARILCTLVAAVAAFLLFNLPHPWRTHASVFLGDAGSMFLGFVLVWFAVDLSQQQTDGLYAISAVWILGLPIMDTVYLMVRRMLVGRSPFTPDRRHVHHTLIFLGLSETQTLWMLLGVSALFGAVGFFGWYLRVPEYFLAYAFLATFAVHCVIMQFWREILGLLGIKTGPVGPKKEAITDVTI